VTPTVAGNLMLGPSAKDVHDTHDVSTSLEELAYVAWAARRTVPTLDMEAAVTSFSGLRAKPSGKDFIIKVSSSFVWCRSFGYGSEHRGGFELPRMYLYLRAWLGDTWRSSKI
jgi:glycerol-3-phosphate dehydrogenase